MYCENLSQRFGDSLVGTWCDENVQGEKLAPGLDGFAADYQVKQEGVTSLSGAKTIIAWCKFKDFERSAPIASLRADADIEAGWRLWVLPNGQIEFGLGDGCGGCDRFASPDFARRRLVSFVAVVIDEQGFGRIYNNASKTDLHQLTSEEKAASVLYIGQDPVCPWNKIDGSIQCVSAFSRALTHEEIMSIYESGFEEVTTEEEQG
jgi:hypothetical protein